MVAKAIEGVSLENVPSGPRQEIGVQTYMDVQDRLGVEWPERIRDELASADVTVAIIGPEWLSATDRYFKRRIDDPLDWVRQEIEAALGGRGTLVPVLFDGAEMPPPTALPESISALSNRQGLPIRTTSFDSDIQPLLRELLEHGRQRIDANYIRSADDYERTRWPIRTRRYRCVRPSFLTKIWMLHLRR